MFWCRILRTTDDFVQSRITDERFSESLTMLFYVHRSYVFPAGTETTKYNWNR